jgi:C-methyltransferase C-terminal domain/Methyltransferase domain/Putative zinc binding domain
MTGGTCLLCGSVNLEHIIELRPTPPANALAATVEEARRALRFPLRLVRCAECGHVQLADQVDRDLLFRDYKYATGTAPGLVRHFGALARMLIERHRLAPGSRVVEVGSNDGTLLREFAAAGMRVLGVDPATDLARYAGESGVPTYATHFDDGVAERILAEHGPADLVLANNVLAHVGDLNGALRGVRLLLEPGSHGVFEAAHLLPMAANGMYEFIYHEHMSYFSLHTMRAAVNRHGMEVVDVEEVATQGGSIRYWVRPADAVTSADISPRVAELMRREESAGITDGDLVREFAARASRVNTGLRDVINGLRAAGKRICGYGASARAVTLMNQAGIGDAIDWIVDDNPRKVGLYVPGSAIPVVASSTLGHDAADYCVVFAWNFWSDITEKLADFTRGGGMFVVPFPELAVR